MTLFELNSSNIPAFIAYNIFEVIQISKFNRLNAYSHNYIDNFMTIDHCEIRSKLIPCHCFFEIINSVDINVNPNEIRYDVIYIRMRVFHVYVNRWLNN